MSELIGIAHLSKSESLEILPLGSFFIYNINGHKSQDARQWIMGKTQTVIKRKTQDHGCRSTVAPYGRQTVTIKNLLSRFF